MTEDDLKQTEIHRQARRQYPHPHQLDAAFLRPQEVRDLRALVELNALEREIDNLIKGEPDLLSSLLHFASTGHHDGMVYPQQTIRPCRANALKLLTQQHFKQVVGIERTRQALTWQTLGTGLLT